MPIAVLKPNATTTDAFYVHADHLGTPRKVTRPSDNKTLWTWESEAFGNSPANENPSNLGNFTYNLRFPGQYYDQEMGLHYNMARYYNPGGGGYDQSDPMGLAGGINTYAYVNGNPVNAVDPLGLYVVFEGSNDAVEELLRKAYKKVRGTNKGKELCEKLESSPDKYTVTNKSNIPFISGDRATYHPYSKTIVADPNYHPRLNTEAGRQAATTEIILGHELGHAATGIIDDPNTDHMENVNANENPIRQELGYPNRITYP
jgi:RHS repeat-associated protein